jgi:hypothetical protein
MHKWNNHVQFFIFYNIYTLINFNFLYYSLAASVLKCGKKKVWLDPNETAEIGNANSRQNIRKLIKDSFIVRKPHTIHSKSRHQRHIEAKGESRIVLTDVSFIIISTRMQNLFNLHTSFKLVIHTWIVSIWKSIWNNGNHHHDQL